VLFVDGKDKMDSGFAGMTAWGLSPQRPPAGVHEK
jgi:hypothetical protein